MATLYILYGSATGNAEQIAKDLAEKPLPSQFSSVVCKPLNDFKKFTAEWDNEPQYGRKHGLILISSTTGNGDAPENASGFVRFIKRKQTAETQPFRHCAVAVLGLGDTNYDNFCAMGKAIDMKVTELGAERAMPLACADDATGLEDVVEPWLDDVFVNINAACGSEPGLVEEETKDDAQLVEADSAEASSSSKPLPSQSDSPLYIMYGSATGNSEQIAKDLAASYERLLENPDALAFFPSVVCCELNQFKKHLPLWEEENAGGSKHGLIIVASTTGNAEAPENCSRFMSFIKRRQNMELQPFRNVGFSVLALGDSNYDVFCATGKEIDRKLSALGGKSAKALACADEGTGLEDVVDPWTMSVIFDISTTCRGAPLQGSSATLPSAEPAATKSAVSRNNDEEKKSECVVDVASQNTTTSTGVTTIKGMLGLKDDSNIPEVPLTLLPSLGASRSSCELFHDDYDPPRRSGRYGDNATISTSSSDNFLYTQSRPYESSLVAARYLTKTSVDAALRITDATGPGGAASLESFVKARELLESAFPLDVADPPAMERNGKRVIEAMLSLPDDYSLEYQPGDTVGLMVPNDAEAVAFVLEALKEHHGIMPTQKVSINEEHPITVQQALEENVDLCCVLKNKKTINGLVQFATNPQEATALQLLASKDSNGIRLFQEYIIDQRRTFVSILKDFPSCRAITMEGILSLLPAIPPRYYSISSSPLEHREQTSLSIAFSVVDYLTPSLMVNGAEQGRRRIHGLATSFLEVLCAPLLGAASGKPMSSPKVKIFPRPTADFRLPASLSIPMIMIGPGTGIAPFMGFLAHRKAQAMAQVSHEAGSAVVEGTWRGGYELEANDLPVGDKDSKGLDPAADFRQQEDVGEIEVFFGCRHEGHDWLFQDELKGFAAKGPITNLHTAFSRGDHKQYVQDLMKETATSERLTDLLLTKAGIVYICGDGNSMARDVQKTFAEILGRQDDGSFDLEKGRGEIDRLKKEGRFLLDIWS